MEKSQKVRIGQLNIDPKLTELRPINPVYVSRLRQAYRTGAYLPPLIVEAGTNRVISGNHRMTAMLYEYGPDHETEVIFRRYANELEALKDFARENATHGLLMDGITRKRVVAALLDHGATLAEVSQLLNVPVKSLQSWGEHFVAVIGENGTQRHVPVKRGFPAHQTVLTAEKYEEHKRADRGIKAEELIDQLLRWLRNGWIEPRDSIIYNLEELRKQIAVFLKKAKAA